MDPSSLLPIIKDAAIATGVIGLLAFLFGARGAALSFSLLGAAILGGLLGYFNSPDRGTSAQPVELQSTTALANIPSDPLSTAGAPSATNAAVPLANAVASAQGTDYGQPYYFTGQDPDTNGHPFYFLSSTPPNDYDQLTKQDIQNRNEAAPPPVVGTPNAATDPYWWMKPKP